MTCAQGLADLIAGSEEWLLARVIEYGRDTGFAPTAASLREAWRASIRGLGQSLTQFIQSPETPGELTAAMDFHGDPACAFGVLEAQRHRRRGVTVTMFLALMKYYRRSYLDLLDEPGAAGLDRALAARYIDRFFDRTELGFCAEWLDVGNRQSMQEMQQANRALTDEKNKYLMLFASQPNPALLLDGGGRVDAINDAAARLFCGAHAPVAHYYGMLPGVELFPWLLAPLAKLQRDPGGSYAVDVVCETTDGPRQYAVQMEKVRAVGGDLIGTLVILNDITDRKQAEQAQRLTAVGELAAGVAHDFNNLLAAMATHAEAALPRAADERSRAFASTVAHLATRGSAVCRSLMAFASCHRPEPTPAAIEQPIEAALLVAGPHLDAAGVQVFRDYTAGLPLVAIDTGQIEQVFVNLLLNSRDAMPQGGSLTVATRLDAGANGAVEVRASVTDTGSGIAPEHLPRIFEPFFTTKQRPDGDRATGSGLGLPVSHGIVAAHGGTITVHSHEGGGTTFELCLPIAQEARPAAGQSGDEDTAAHPGTAASGAAPPQGGARRVLLAEDEDGSRDILCQFLTRAGYEVTAVATTAEAASALQEASLDLVVSDLLMPGGGGRELLSQAMTLPHPPPVVIITGSIDTGIHDELMGAGAARCLLKPFSLKELAATIKGILDTPEATDT